MDIEVRRPDTVIPAADFASRRKRLAKRLQTLNLDALIVSQAANRFYLSGFELHDGQPNETSGFLVITATGDDWLVTDPRYKDAAAKLWPEDKILIYRSGLAKSLANLLASLGCFTGFDPDDLSWHYVRQLKSHAKRGLVFLPVSGLVEKMRAIKEPSEIAALENSFRLNHNALAWLEKALADGSLLNISEKQLAWETEKFFRENGAQELAFATIAAFGQNGAMPHAIPQEITLAAEQPVLIDLGCRVDNYCSDQTRSYWHGKNPDARFQSSLRLVREAQEAALDIMRPGVACSRVYEAALNVFQRAGVEKAFTHGLGHGVGLETHEAPSLSPKSAQILEENMVVTVEPGLYYPEWGGVRWEYTVILEKDGPRVL